MRLGRLSDELEPSAEPNMTPLIDIVFILLIFFLVTTTFAKNLGIEVDTPSASSGIEQSSNPIRVAVGRNGEVAVDGRVISKYRLRTLMKSLLLKRDDAQVVVVADKTVDAELVVSVMDECRTAGAKEIALSVEQK